MARLYINTNLKSVVVVGEFCGWDVDKAIRSVLKKRAKQIIFEDMPAGEYQVLCCKSYHGREVYPTDGRAMPKRYFNGVKNESIYCYFEKGEKINDLVNHS